MVIDIHPAIAIGMLLVTAMYLRFAFRGSAR